MLKWESHIQSEKSKLIAGRCIRFLLTQISYIIQNVDLFWTKPIAKRGDGGLAAYVVNNTKLTYLSSLECY